jgi:allophanate hydrolase
MPDLSNLPLTISQLREGYESGAFTAADVIREIYRRIRAFGDNPAWIHLVPEEAALAAASGYRPGLLSGIPFAVKDNIDVAGIPTTAGCPAFAYTPKQTATVVQRLLDGGAILIGKTNLDQFATGLVGTRSSYGPCRNVFNPDYISGGSSAGSAVAVAAGLVSFSLGTDTAGSGRIPAAFNNIIGLKPTRGLLSTTGVVPACRSLDCVSIFALTLADAQTVLFRAAGPDTADPFSRNIQPASWISNPPRIVAPLPRNLEFFGDSESARLFDEAVARLRTNGAEVAFTDISPFLDAAKLLYGGPWVAERFAAVGEFMKSHPADCDPTVRDIILAGEKPSAVDAFRAQYELERLRNLSAEIWKSADALILPTAPTIYKIADVQADPVKLNSRLGTYTNFMNLLDLSGLAVPAGFRSDGLPFGVTLVAPAFCDANLIDIARNRLSSLYKQKLGGTGLDTPNRQQIIGLSGARPRKVPLAVVGAHLSGQPLNRELTKRRAHLVRTTSTAPDYRLFALKNTDPPKPGLMRVEPGTGAKIEVEVWSLSTEAFGSFVDEIPPPMAIGSIRLEDGHEVKGFLCEPIALSGAEDISRHRGWRAYLASRDAP